ncbi:hypothetical protein [Cupriavidus sp. UGS-1]|uniref:hypothetical protein n=1 Tax=Cupriavidus sp. UGS-1 TaxID=2899826 RepID=UPI001E62281D|nr:hypothetical protein [Cupriavidus sp. UGS-1]MCD9123701.1 hypothetical protein [Cupriavidus sp. UGS-1]
MKKDAIELFVRLAKMKPLPHSEARSWLEIKILKLTSALRWIAGAIFLFLVFVAGLITIWPESRIPAVVVAAQILGISSVVCAVSGLVLDVVPAIVTVVLADKYAQRRQVLAVKHDLEHVEALLREPSGAMEIACNWLDAEIRRINARLGLFAGSPDKLAFISLAGLGWAAWKETEAIASGWLATSVQFGLAFLCGGAIGGLLLRDRLTRLAYHRELLDMALTQKRKMVASAEFTN